MNALLEATAPAEARGVARDGVRLMVANAADRTILHRRFAELPDVLALGDVLVVNTSATLPAAIDARDDRTGESVTVHVSTAAPDTPGCEWWVVELRADGGVHPLPGNHVGRRLTLDGGAGLRLVARYEQSDRLLLARVVSAEPLPAILHRHGRPIRYAYVGEPHPLADYQTVFATQAGSAEMPSASRPFTHELVTRLVSRGIWIAPLTLHTGVSSPEAHEPPFRERFAVPETTAAMINAAPGRVVAAGTTVVRALETVAREDGSVIAGEGWTDVVVTPERGIRVARALITGWHPPEASHLQMLEAIAGRELLAQSYEIAREAGYLHHEFGDAHLILG